MLHVAKIPITEFDATYLALNLPTHTVFYLKITSHITDQ